MPKFNKTFELTIEDIELIEYALHKEKAALSLDRVAMIAGKPPSDQNYKSLQEVEDTLADIHDLLGRLHNQKIFYRPETVDDLPYVGG